MAEVIGTVITVCSWNTFYDLTTSQWGICSILTHKCFQLRKIVSLNLTDESFELNYIEIVSYSEIAQTSNYIQLIHKFQHTVANILTNRRANHYTFVYIQLCMYQQQSKSEYISFSFPSQPLNMKQLHKYNSESSEKPLTFKIRTIVNNKIHFIKCSDCFSSNCVSKVHAETLVFRRSRNFATFSHTMNLMRKNVKNIDFINRLR